MNRQRRVLSYLSQARDLIRAGHSDHLAILGRLDNAAIAAGIGGWREVRASIDAAEDCFLMGRYRSAAHLLRTAMTRIERLHGTEGPMHSREAVAPHSHMTH